MSKHLFQFKQFLIRQDACAMKVGTDGILLGAWAKQKETQRILDIGTGTGLLALMAAQNHLAAHVDAVERDRSAAKQAQENVKESPWAKRIQVFHADIKTFSSPHLFDLILCNPPFFQEGIRPKDHARSQARHSTHLTYQELVRLANQFMNESGTLALIIPHAAEADMCHIAADHGLFPSDILRVCPRQGKAFHRSLLAFQRKEQQVDIKHLSIHDDDSGHYSEAFQRLTGAFYL